MRGPLGLAVNSCDIRVWDAILQRLVEGSMRPRIRKEKASRNEGRNRRRERACWDQWYWDRRMNRTGIEPTVSLPRFSPRGRETGVEDKSWVLVGQD